MDNRPSLIDEGIVHDDNNGVSSRENLYVIAHG